jgi:ferredoxin
MANKNARFKQNIDGKYYVDDSCIACDACCVEAPKFFAMNDDEGHAYVKLQPITPDDLTDAENALAACPVEAIGNDG